jgi:signal transduction histidine kinase
MALLRSLPRVTLARPLARLAGPRPWVMLAAFVFVSGLFGAFAYEFVRSQTDSRRQAERSFQVQARITAELTASLFQSSAAGTAATAAKEFAGPAPSDVALTKLARRSHLAYALILDHSGRTLAASAGAPAGQGRSIRTEFREALAGRPWLSDLLPVGGRGGPVVAWALPFQTPSGPRVEVEAFEASALAGFLRGYLKLSAANSSQLAYIVDGRNRVIADSTGIKRLGSTLSGALVRRGGGRYNGDHVSGYVAAAPLTGANWRVLLSEPTAVLYPALAGSRSWILSAALAAFGLFGIVALVLLRRMLIGTARVVEANQQLGELNATLEARVAEGTAVAEQRAAELARSNSELEQFASVASHDLQEPLRKIRMYAQRLPQRAGDGLPADAVSDLTRMHDAAERMQRLIDDLLSFARVTSRHREFEPVDLSALAHEVVGDLEARVRELDAEVEIGQLPIVAADRGQIAQLLQNLVSNALKFHRPGIRPTVRIRAELVEGGQPRFRGESVNGRRCLIAVEDNGIGFDPKYAERIFSAFERLHSRSDYEGTGIGLSIARKIAWRHGGELTATSTPGQGSTFTLTLPLAEPTSAPVEEAA